MMTLDELLGNQTQTQNQTQTTERFPSYEEFASSRSNAVARNQEEVRDNMSYSQFGYNQSSTLPAGREEYAQDIVRPTSRTQSFYEYVARQNKETTDAELYSRLSRTNNSRRPVFGPEEDTQITPVFHEVKADRKARGRLNLKGKLILGTFLALVVTTVALIIAYAGKINDGTAVVPSSNEGAVAVSTQSVNL